MSLDVPGALLERAERGEVSDTEFIDVVRTSLPYAWQVVSQVVADLAADRARRFAFAEHAVPPPGEVERGQLLRALASDAIRGGLERYFGIRLAFQNCHRVAAFLPSAVDGAAWRAFVSPRGQLLNQGPAQRRG
jgi:hypothetical protein